MPTRFRSRQFSWRRVWVGVLIGAAFLFASALVFLYLTTHGIATRM